MYCPICGNPVKEPKPVIHPKYGSPLVDLNCSACGESCKVMLNETREQLARRLGVKR